MSAILCTYKYVKIAYYSYLLKYNLTYFYQSSI